MAILIPDEIIKQSGVSEKDLKIDLAAWLYQKEIFTLAQAANFAKLTRLEMQKALAKRSIDLHIAPQDIEDDFRTLQSLNLA